MQEPDFASRAMGCLLGGAIGDAFGYEIEFDSQSRVRHRFGRIELTLSPVRHGGNLDLSHDTLRRGSPTDPEVLPAGRIYSTSASLKGNCSATLYAFSDIFSRPLQPSKKK